MNASQDRDTQRNSPEREPLDEGLTRVADGGTKPTRILTSLFGLESTRRSGTIRRCLTRALLPLALCAGAAPISAQSIEARVDVSGLLCVDTTAEPYSDEPFIVGSWTILGSSYASKMFEPPPQKVYPYWWNPSFWYWKYPTFDDIDAGEKVFSNNRTMWRGWIRDGETIVIALAFWEKDSGYTAFDYAEDMAKVVIAESQSWLLGGGFSAAGMAKMIIFSVQFLFGAGADDPLGDLVVELTNRRGTLFKKATAGKYSFIGGATYYDSVRAWPSQVSYYKSLGYSVVSYSFGMYTMIKPIYYGPLSKSRKTVRFIHDGAGGERYQSSVQVRTGPFTSSKPGGTCSTWTTSGNSIAY